MDYYDDGNYRSTRSKGGRAKAIAKWAGVVVVSAVVGSASTMLAVPYLIQTNVIASPALTSVNLQNASYSVKPVTVQTSDATVQAVKKVIGSVVGVVNYQAVQNASGMPGSTLQETGVGSGVIFDPRGYIVTNYHVVQGASKVEVVLYNKKHVYASVVGYDPYTDLAVLKIPSTDITPSNVAQFGNSATLQLGEPAIAIGNPAGLDFADSVTAGVISATSRTMPVIDEASGNVIGEETVLQTDAAINPGNSGGPLANIEGQVIGINSSKIVAQGFSGMGFAIPINEVKTIVSEIMTTGHALHPAIGIEAESLSSVPAQYQPNIPVNYGVWVYQVTSQAAKQAGIKHGDVIVAINGKKVTGFSSLRTILWNDFKPGQVVTVTVYRSQQKLNLQLKLGDLPLPSSGANSANSSSNSNSGGGTIIIPNPFGGGSGSGNGSGSGSNGGSNPFAPFFP